MESRQTTESFAIQVFFLSLVVIKQRGSCCVMLRAVVVVLSFPFPSNIRHCTIRPRPASPRKLHGSWANRALYLSEKLLFPFFVVLTAGGEGETDRRSVE